MEKRGSGKSRGSRRLAIACLGVSLVACLSLGLALIFLETSRREEVDDIKAKFEALTMELAEMRASLTQCQNTTSYLLQNLQNQVKQYDYDDDYDYDYDYEESPNKNETKRGKRSIRQPHHGKYNVKIIKAPKHFESKGSVPIQARIFVNSPNNYGEQEHSFREEKIDYPIKKDRKWNEETEEFPIPKAVQYGGETAHFHRHHRPQNYVGNSRMYHTEGIFRDWSPSEWVSKEADFYMDNGTGVLTVGSPGLYFVYAQIFYANTADTSGFRIIRNGKPEFECRVTTISERSHPMKRNTCYTGGILRLRSGDRIAIREAEGERYTYHERTKSFFGMFLIGGE